MAKPEVTSFGSKDEDRKCEFEIGIDMAKSPHIHEAGVYENLTGPVSKIYDTVLDHVGNTPMIRINRIGKEENIECEILAKCEFFSAGGSVKDRIGKRMVLDAEKSGRIKHGDTLIEPTSGNTGIGLALAAAIRGYKIIITLPEKMSNEKVNVLKGLGAQIIRTPTEAAFDSPESHIGVASRLNREIPNSHILDQYSNPSNPLAHFDGTAEEILKQCNDKVDMIVISAGTGGTITGIAYKIKMKLPNCIIVGVDPHGSILAQPETLNKTLGSYAVEGIGYDFIPKVLNRKVVDYWVKTSDRESFAMARRLIREEGFFCGGSSGSAMIGAIDAIKKFGLKKGQRCVVILPDSVRNYMSKFLSDDWMVENDFMEDSFENTKGQKSWWADRHVSDLKLSMPITVSPDVTCQQAVDIMTRNNYDQLPVLKDENVLGVVTSATLTTKLCNGQVSSADSVTKVMIKQFKKVTLQSSLNQLSKILGYSPFVLVQAEQTQYISSEVCSKKSTVVGILTRIDLLNYITKGAHHEKRLKESVV